MFECRHFARFEPRGIRGALGPDLLHFFGQRGVAGAREKLLLMLVFLRVVFERLFEFGERATLQVVELFVLVFFAAAQRARFVEIGRRVERCLIHLVGAAEAEEIREEPGFARLALFERLGVALAIGLERRLPLRLTFDDERFRRGDLDLERFAASLEVEPDHVLGRLRLRALETFPRRLERRNRARVFGKVGNDGSAGMRRCCGSGCLGSRGSSRGRRRLGFGRRGRFRNGRHVLVGGHLLLAHRAVSAMPCSCPCSTSVPKTGEGVVRQTHERPDQLQSAHCGNARPRPPAPAQQFDARIAATQCGRTIDD